MRRSARNSAVLAVAMATVAMLVAAFGTSSASAFEVTKWEAGTCIAEGCN
jgi:hypothetical protein